MKVNKIFQDFLNSDESEKIFKLSETESIKFSFIELKHGLKLIFRHQSDNYDNFLLQEYKYPLFVVDKDNEIIFMPKTRGFGAYSWLNYHKYLDDFIDEKTYKEEQMELGQLENKITNECFDILKQNLELIDKKILETINLDEYREDAIRRFKDKNELYFPLKASDVILNQDIIADYFYDKNELSKNIFSCLSAYKLAEYEKYIAHKECIRQYKKALETNPELKSLNDICSVVNGKTQSFVIHYRNQKGELKKHTFKKNVSRMNITNKTILNHQVLDTIPIECIEKITWRSDVLYDANNYNKFKFTEEQTASRLILLGHEDDVKSDSFDKEKVMTNVILANAELIKIASPRLLASPDFILNIMKNLKSERNHFLDNCRTDLEFYTLRQSANKKNIFLNSSPILKKNKDFILEYIALSEDDYNTHYLVDYGSGPAPYTVDFFDSLQNFTSSFEFCRLLIEKIGVEKVIDLIPDEFINREKMIETLQNVKEKSKHRFNIYHKINTIKNLELLFTPEEIKQNICNIHPDILQDRDFILKYTKNNPYSLNTSTIYDLYHDDDKVMNNIITSIDFIPNCKKYLNYAGIKTTDSSDIFELCNKNINFFGILLPDDIKLFMDGEFYDIEKIISSPTEINIHTPNCIFNLNNYAVITIINKENPENKISLNHFHNEIEYIKETINNALKQNYKVRSKLLESVINEITENEKRKEEIER